MSLMTHNKSEEVSIKVEGGIKGEVKFVECYLEIGEQMVMTVIAMMAEN